MKTAIKSINKPPIPSPSKVVMMFSFKYVSTKVLYNYKLCQQNSVEK